ncbi:hypothetical protein [Acidithiobacillus caldus]|uniref:Uncharacterized protein n=1 Tax=Acidithiobacillus caldus TaxID=33059 RepID=A0A1E7YN83_9PROT|nr:hypothetical protein [Acidithiobacillus caldus]OFC35531.1 hypothetical protein BAE29_15370 [Acidithiobacillus caldus]OFC36380.1 hypothetical protein BAE27_06270 [Acidithiobacillus caldus]OFC40446.1 hypothetical protein BAE28_00090 [Acidithiobacillus caldus]OFC62175.1 hypothetical protein BAE30_02690 [Acidithiobacillus caldus]
MEQLPVIAIQRNGRVRIYERGKPVTRFSGLAYDTITNAFVWIDAATGWLIFLVSETLERALCELEYLQAKFA